MNTTKLLKNIVLAVCFLFWGGVSFAGEGDPPDPNDLPVEPFPINQYEIYLIFVAIVLAGYFFQKKLISKNHLK